MRETTPITGTAISDGYSALSNSQFKRAIGLFETALGSGDADQGLALRGLLMSLNLNGWHDRVVQTANSYPGIIAADPLSQTAYLGSILNSGNHRALHDQYSRFDGKITVPQASILRGALAAGCGDTHTALSFLIPVLKDSVLRGSAFLYLSALLADSPRLSNEEANQLFAVLSASAGRDEVMLDQSRYAHDEKTFAALPPTVTEVNLQDPGFPFHAMPSLNSRICLEEGFSGETAAVPVPDLPQYLNHLEGFKQIVRNTLRKPGLAPLVEALRSAASDAGDKPMFQVVSTGRAGTTSLFELLRHFPDLYAYHRFRWQMLPTDRNMMLAAMAGVGIDPSGVEGLIERYIRARFAEILLPLKRNRAPAFLSHWETPFVLVWQAVFPSLRVLWLDRSAEGVFRSFVGKNQWVNGQVQDVSYLDGSLEEGRFDYTIDSSLSMEHEIAWYLKATRTMAGLAQRGCKPGCFMHIAAESLFRCEDAAIRDLADFFMIDRANIEAIRSHYTKSINAKDNRQAQEASSLDERTERFLSML